MSKEKWIFAGLLGVFLVAYFLPIGNLKIHDAIIDAFRTLQWYAIYHTLACVVPAMFIAGAIATFLSKESILKHLGPKANPIESYGVASVSGTVLAVCSCSVLPMFAGIYRIGAGLGPAATFLVAGPALNVMAIFLTARVLGFELGVARTVTAISMSIVIGLLMASIFRKSEEARIATTMQLPKMPPPKRKLWQTAAFLGVMVTFLVFSDWVNPGTKIFTIASGSELVHLDNVAGKQVLTLSSPLKIDVSISQQTSGDVTFQVHDAIDGFDKLTPDEQKFFEPGNRFLIATKNIFDMTDNVPENYRFAATVFQYRWYFCLACAFLLAVMTARWFEREELAEWMARTWSFPTIFGIGTAVPVLVFAGIIALNAQLLGKAFSVMSRIDWWMRTITGTLFIVIGVWLSLRYVYEIL